MIRYLLLISISILSFSVSGQTKVVKLTLEEVIDLASHQSLDAFRQQNMYRASYWGYKYYNADRLPFLAIGSNPFSYNNSLRQDYSVDSAKWKSSQQKNSTSSASLKMSQNVGFTGGTFSVSSDLGMTKNFLGKKETQFSANQLVVGYNQRLNGFNSLRWKSKNRTFKV